MQARALQSAALGILFPKKANLTLHRSPTRSRPGVLGLGGFWVWGASRPDFPLNQKKPKNQKNKKPKKTKKNQKKTQKTKTYPSL